MLVQVCFLGSEPQRLWHLERLGSEATHGAPSSVVWEDTQALKSSPELMGFIRAPRSEDPYQNCRLGSFQRFGATFLRTLGLQVGNGTWRLKWSLRVHSQAAASCVTHRAQVPTHQILKLRGTHIERTLSPKYTLARSTWTDPLPK